ncbi:hypothetical protein L3X38_037077 [Prunus dulcis]|uniref:Reverse transcriptase/retrotransposon-derived protein RNase H-like domain-containing protein n=1 Tax=Prunus dulcis TaxID=3755 RepID=A0AAD4V2F4_PRUDU|nr:hypothetical protein L3X38_037077 [Prunus dulcis]
MEAVREETKTIEARAKEMVLEAVRAEREILLKQFSQLIPNFDPNLLNKTPITPIPLLPLEQSPTNPMSDNASCSGATNVRPLVFEEENPTNDADAAEKRQDEMITEAPVPALMNLHKPFEVEADASNYVMGVVLFQDGKLVPYHYEIFSGPVLNYPTYDKEQYAMHQAVKHWRAYLLGKEVVVTASLANEMEVLPIIIQYCDIVQEGSN